jgi:hypothetical protein
MLPEPASTVTLCGHPEAVNGHCGTGGCGNDWRLCAWPQCRLSPLAIIPLEWPGRHLPRTRLDQAE